MIARLTPILIVFFLFAAGCEALTGGARTTGYDPPPTELTTAGVIVQPVEVVYEPLVVDRTYKYDTPLKIEVEYAAPDLKEPCKFDAVVASKVEGQTYTIELKVTPTPLLVVTNANVYVTGKRPAVGGGQTGTLGDGTAFILEPDVNGHDYVYLLKGVQVLGFDYTLAAVALDSNNPLQPVMHYRGFRWNGAGHGPILPINDSMDPDRKNAMDRMIRIANQVGLYPP